MHSWLHTHSDLPHASAHTHNTRFTVTLMKSVYSLQTLSSQLVLHIYTSGDSIESICCELYVVCVRECLRIYMWTSLHMSVCVCVCVWPSAVPATCALHGWISLYRYRRWLAAHICGVVTRVWHSRHQVRETEGRKIWKGVKKVNKHMKKEAKKDKQTHPGCVWVFMSYLYSWGWSCSTEPGRWGLSNIQWHSIPPAYNLDCTRSGSRRQQQSCFPYGGRCEAQGRSCTAWHWSGEQLRRNGVITQVIICDISKNI